MAALFWRSGLIAERRHRLCGVGATRTCIGRTAPAGSRPQTRLIAEAAKDLADYQRLTAEGQARGGGPEA